MEVQPRLRSRTARIFFLASALMLCMGAWADGAQTPNPLYLQARDLWQRISASQMPTDQKADFGKRFGDLAAEQRQLWSEAGAVDSGECADQCLENYNAEIEQWQSGLSAFSSDAQAALDAPSLPEKGTWSLYGQFTHINSVCRQTWTCGPSGQVMHDPDMLLVSTPAKTLTGVCQSSAADPTDPCAACTASWKAPDDVCLWHLEPGH